MGEVFMGNQSQKAWICPVCGYIHYGDTPPEECPVCDASGSSFESYTETQTVEINSASENVGTVVIAGAGIAGVSAAEAIRKMNTNTRVILISKEPGLPYFRINLTRYLAGEVHARDLLLHPREWYQEQGIEIFPGTKIKNIQPGNKFITLESGDEIKYDRLILTAGAHPFFPPIDGVDRKNVTALRTQADADFILSAARSGKIFVCIGGGILGLETAGAIARLGVQVTVLEAMKWLMPRQLNRNAASVFEKKVKRLGISLKTNVKTRAITGDGAAAGVMLEDGTLIPADVVVISAGVRSNVDLARAAGLNVNQGIVVDDRMQTSDPDVFAAGDAAEHRGILYGTWTPAQLQGSIAGMSAVNSTAAFPGVPRANTLKVLGIDLYSIGLISPENPDDRVVEEEIGENYFCFVFRKNTLAGAILLGDTSIYALVKKAVEEQTDFSALLKAKPGVLPILQALKV
jgi:nitrite reductase (NADH) large subunit